MKRLIFIPFFSIIIIAISCNQNNRITEQQLKNDLDTLVSILEDVHINPYYKYPRQLFYTAIDSIKRGIHKPLTDKEFFLKLAPIVTKLEDGHTFLKLPELDNKLILPFEVKTQMVEPYIVVSETSGEIPLNAEILSINGIDSKTIIEEFVRYESGEDLIFRAEWLGYSFGQYLKLIYGIDKECIVEYKTKNKIIESRIALINNKRKQLFSGVDNIQSLAFSLHIKPEISTAIIDLRSFSDIEHVDSIFSIIKKEQLTNLIIDIRENGGGNSDVGDEFLQYLASSDFQQYNIDKTIIKTSKLVKRKYNKELNELLNSDALTKTDSLEIRKLQNLINLPTGSFTQCPYATNLITLKNNSNRFEGNLFVLTSKKTYSSASDFAQTIKAYKIGNIIGEETGGWIVCYGDIVLDELPNSKLVLGISTVKFVNIGADPDDWHGVIPDINIDADKSMDYVINEIKKRTTSN
jgi:hypothetical protein